MENKLMMSQKEECDNYNLITETINKLVDMCDNTEAIVLRDELFELFITKYSEPLYNVLGLQEELGCLLEVVFKAVQNGIYAKDLPNENKLNYIPSVALSNVETEWYLSNHRDFCVNVRDYKTLFWLKEDKSE